MFATGETVGLAEWIIDDTRLVLYVLPKSWKLGLVVYFLRLTLYFRYQKDVHKKRTYSHYNYT